MGTIVGEQDNTTATAGARLRVLQQEFTQPATRGRSGRPGPRAPHPAPPIDLGVLEHVRKSVAEMVTHTRAENPTAGPAPLDHSDVYAWAREHTAHLEPERKAVRDAIVYRQSLEHGLRANDETVIRREACPACACWSLMWRRVQAQAVCINRYCTTPAGRPQVWSLAQLAQHAVKISSGRAATS